MELNLGLSHLSSSIARDTLDKMRVFTPRVPENRTQGVREMKDEEGIATRARVSQIPLSIWRKTAHPDTHFVTVHRPNTSSSLSARSKIKTKKKAEEIALTQLHPPFTLDFHVCIVIKPVTRAGDKALMCETFSGSHNRELLLSPQG